MRPTRARTRWSVSAVMVVAALVIAKVLLPAVSNGDPVAQPSPRPSYPASWSAYTPPDGSFRLMAPGDGTEQDVQTDAGVLHRTDFVVPGDGAWFVEWLDVAPAVLAGRSEADLVDLALAPMADRLGAQIDEEDILRDGSHPGVELHMSSPDGKAYLVRVLSVGGRLVEATAELASGASPGDAERFVGSLELALS